MPIIIVPYTVISFTYTTYSGSVSTQPTTYSRCSGWAYHIWVGRGGTLGYRTVGGLTPILGPTPIRQNFRGLSYHTKGPITVFVWYNPVVTHELEYMGH